MTEKTISIDFTEEQVDMLRIMVYQHRFCHINDYIPKTYGVEALKDLQLLITKSHRKHYD